MKVFKSKEQLPPLVLQKVYWVKLDEDEVVGIIDIARVAYTQGLIGPKHPLNVLASRLYVVKHEA